MRDAFEKKWQPQSRGDNQSRRFPFVRQYIPEQRKAPLQLDLFKPLSYCFYFKVLINNPKDSLAKAVMVHEGRSS